MLLQELFRDHYRPLALAGKRPSTHRQYHYAIAKLEAHLGRQATLEDLNDHTIAQLLSWLESGGNGRCYQPRTVNNCRAYILALWRFANRKGLVPVGPDVQKRREPDEPPVAFTLAELSKLLATASKRKDGLWWVAMLSAIYSTGERIGAMMLWERDWIDFESGVVTVPAKARKGRQRGKTYGLQADALVAILQLVKTHDDDLVFSTDRALPTLYSRFNQILKEAQLPSGRQWKFHAIRKTHASILARDHGAATAQESLGHASRRSTDRYLAPRITGAARHDQLLPKLDDRKSA